MKPATRTTPLTASIRSSITISISGRAASQVTAIADNRVIVWPRRKDRINRLASVMILMAREDENNEQHDQIKELFSHDLSTYALPGPGRLPPPNHRGHL